MIGFYHIPRTGGFAYAATLGRAGIDYVMYHDFDKVDAVHPDTTVTLLREPRARLVSEYLFRRDIWGIPVGTPAEFVAEQAPCYADAVARADQVLITEHLTVRRINANSTTLDVDPELAELLWAATVEDRAVYARYCLEVAA